MRRRYLRVALLVGLVLLAGCAGGNGGLGGPTDPATTTDSGTTASTSAGTDTPPTSTPSTAAPNFSRSEARERARAEERERILAALSNVTGIRETSVGVYGETETEVEAVTEDGYVVRVSLSYSYAYDCGGNAGVVDGLTTEAVYEVTAENVTLRAIAADVKTVC